MSVLSEENTNLLFGLFDDIIKETNQKVSINDNTQLKQFITQQCYYYHNKRFDFANDINEMNKKIIDNSFRYYNQMIDQKKELEQRQKESDKLQEQMKKNTTNINQTMLKPVFAARPTSNINNNSNITVEYEKKKNDFISHINPKQKEIDFSDPNKDQPINNLDIIMNQTLADRQKELMQITHQYNNTNQTKDWLNTKLTNKSDFEPSQPVEILKIDTSSDLKLETQEIKRKEKRVSFNIEDANTPLSMNSLLSKLKRKSEPQNTKKVDMVRPINDSVNTVFIENKKKEEHLLTLIEKFNIVILNQENVLKEINNIKSNQDKILYQLNEFKNHSLPPI